MAGYIAMIALVLYFGICFGLLNQASSAKNLEPAKSFIAIIPLVYVFLLIRSIFRLLKRRNTEELTVFLACLHVKVALLVILYSFSEVTKEIKTQKKKKIIQQQIHYSEYVRLGSKKTWDNMVCSAQ